MMLAGFLLLLYMFKDKIIALKKRMFPSYEEMSSSRHLSQNQSSNQTNNQEGFQHPLDNNLSFMENRAIALEAANEIEFNSRFNKNKINALDSIQLSIASCEMPFRRTVEDDPIAQMMVSEALLKRAPHVDGAIVLTQQQRQSIAQTFANTHLGKIAQFAHSIDQDGKLIISADAVSFLTTEYDPILLPGGLVAIVVKNEIEPSLYRAFLAKAPLFLQNEKTGEVQRIQYDEIQKYVKSGSFDDFLQRIETLSESDQVLKNELKNLKNEYSKLKTEKEKLEEQNLTLFEALKEARKKREEEKVEPVVTSPNSANSSKKPIENIIYTDKIDKPQKASEEASDVIKDEPILPINLSDFLNTFISKMDTQAVINNRNLWKGMGIVFIYIDNSKIKIFLEKFKFIEKGKKEKHIKNNDMIWTKTLFFDESKNEGYFAYTNCIEVGVEGLNVKAISNQECLHYYSRDAEEYLKKMTDEGFGIEDGKSKTLSDFLNPAVKFKSAWEMV